MKIAIASSGLGHVNRGIEAWAEDLGAALATRGVDAILCKAAGAATRPYERVVPCLTRESPRTQRWLRNLPRRISWRLGLGSGYGIEQTTFACNLIRLLRRERADILHVQDPIVAIWAQRARRVGLIRAHTVLAHGTEEPAPFLRKIQYLQHLAPWHLDRLKAEGIWKPSWTAIPNFIDTERFHPGRSEGLRAELGIPAHASVVLCAAAIQRGHKRIDHLIAEFARLRAGAPDLPVWLVVAGGWEVETEALIAEGTRLLGDRVRFLVRFPRVRMPELYRMADAFVLGSLFEMMPIALIEATASGLPCFVHRHPILEWMTGAGGVPLDMTVDGALARALEQRLAHPSGLREMGSAARAHCVANFSQEAVLDRILIHYSRVLAIAPDCEYKDADV